MGQKPLWRESRPIFHNPEKQGGGEEEIAVAKTETVPPPKETADQRERVEKLLKEYERRRKDLLAVIGEFKQKEDPDLRVKATQYENRVLNETVDPAVLRVLRNLGEADIKKYIDKLMDIANTTLERDEQLAAWLEARNKEMELREHEKIAQGVERYNLMREVNLGMLNELGPFFSTKTYSEISDLLTNGFPELDPEAVKDMAKIQEVITRFAASMNKYKPEFDKAVLARKTEKHERYGIAFQHAIGRVHDRFSALLETNPAGFERQVTAMIRAITEVDLDKAEPKESWSVTYGGLTFAINRGGAGIYAQLTGASEENLARYAKLGEFLNPPKKRTRTAEVRPPEERKIETEL